MRKFTILALALVGALVITPSVVYAATVDDVQADQNAIQKDNAALKKDQAALRRDRAAKAADKAKDDNGQQAVDSTKIGTVQGAIAEKQAEKNVDVKTFHDDKDHLGDDGPDSQ